MRVLTAGIKIKVGKYPGLIAINAKRVALKNTESAMKIGFTDDTDSSSLPGCHVLSARSTKPNNHPSSTMEPKEYIPLRCCQRKRKSVKVKAIVPAQTIRDLCDQPWDAIVAIVKEIKIRSHTGKVNAKRASLNFPPKCGNTGLSAKVVPNTPRPSPTMDASKISRIVDFLLELIRRGSAMTAQG